MGKVTLKQVYELAEKSKGEDRITQSDINQAKKTLGYKDPAPEIKDYMSKGGNAVKPVKAVLGVLALGAAGAKMMKGKGKLKDLPIPGLIGMGASLDSKKKVANLYEKKTEQKTAKMNVGGEVEIIKGEEYIKDLL